MHPGYVEPVPSNSYHEQTARDKATHEYPAHVYPAMVQSGVSVQSSNMADVIHLTLGHSTVLSTGSELRRIYVGDPKVLQSFSSGPKEEVITAKSCGVSTLILWDTGGRRRVFTVFADLDTDGILERLEDAVPGAPAKGGNQW